MHPTIPGCGDGRITAFSATAANSENVGIVAPPAVFESMFATLVHVAP